MAKTHAAPSEETTAAWSRLMRVQNSLLAAVEKDLKSAGYPPLAWYDALLELARHPEGHMRPVDLEEQMLLPQYSMSRLIERMEAAGYVERKSCPVDGRSFHVCITTAGRALQKKMWDVYGAAIERHVGNKLSKGEATSLCNLLGKLK